MKDTVAYIAQAFKCCVQEIVLIRRALSSHASSKPCRNGWGEKRGHDFDYNLQVHAIYRFVRKVTCMHDAYVSYSINNERK